MHCSDYIDPISKEKKCSLYFLTLSIIYLVHTLLFQSVLKILLNILNWSIDGILVGSIQHATHKHWKDSTRIRWSKELCMEYCLTMKFCEYKFFKKISIIRMILISNLEFLQFHYIYGKKIRKTANWWPNRQWQKEKRFGELNFEKNNIRVLRVPRNSGRVLGLLATRTTPICRMSSPSCLCVAVRFRIEIRAGNCDTQRKRVWDFVEGSKRVALCLDRRLVPRHVVY